MWFQSSTKILKAYRRISENLEFNFAKLRDSSLVKSLSWPGVRLLIICISLTTSFISLINYEAGAGQNAFKVHRLMDLNQFNTARVEINKGEKNAEFDLTKFYFERLREECDKKEQFFIASLNDGLGKVEQEFKNLQMAYHEIGWNNHEQCCSVLEDCYLVASQQTNSCYAKVSNKAINLCDGLKAFYKEYSQSESKKIKLSRQNLLDSLNQFVEGHFMAVEDTVHIKLNLSKITYPKKINNYYHQLLNETLFIKLNFQKVIFQYYGNNGGEGAFKIHYYPVINNEYKPGNIIDFIANDCSSTEKRT